MTETPTLDPTCPTCGHPASNHSRQSLGCFTCNDWGGCRCEESLTSVYRHALATVTEERDGNLETVAGFAIAVDALRAENARLETIICKAAKKTGVDTKYADAQGILREVDRILRPTLVSVIARNRTPNITTRRAVDWSKISERLDPSELPLTARHAEGESNG